MAKNQVPCVMASWPLLRKHFTAYHTEMIRKVTSTYDPDFGESMVTGLVEQVFRDLGWR